MITIGSLLKGSFNDQIFSNSYKSIKYLLTVVSGMPIFLKYLALIISISSFSSGYLLTLMALSPDQGDIQRKEYLNRQLSSNYNYRTQFKTPKTAIVTEEGI